MVFLSATPHEKCSRAFFKVSSRCDLFVRVSCNLQHVMCAQSGKTFSVDYFHGKSNDKYHKLLHANFATTHSRTFIWPKTWDYYGMIPFIFSCMPHHADDDRARWIFYRNGERNCSRSTTELLESVLEFIDHFNIKHRIITVIDAKTECTRCMQLVFQSAFNEYCISIVSAWCCQPILIESSAILPPVEYFVEYGQLNGFWNVFAIRTATTIHV